MVKHRSGKTSFRSMHSWDVLNEEHYRDQELRFTVHDSLDYHQLKVSVFNDDKKTDLIGEAWVQLEEVLTPGGGKNDMWHALNYKGRYAGDIRIELTYYDSRPREERPEEALEAMSERSTPNGTRQHKPVKRRPLPANPTQSTSQLTASRGPRPLPGTSADSSLLPSMLRAQEQVNMSSYAMSNHDDSAQSDLYANDADLSDFVEEQTPEPFANSVNNAAQYVRESPNRSLPYPPSPLDFPSSSQSVYGDLSLPDLPPHNPRSSRSSAAATPKHFTPVNSSPAYTLPHYDRSTDATPPFDSRETRQSYQSNQPYNSSPLRSQSIDDPYDNQEVEHFQEESRHYSTGDIPQSQDYDPFSTRGHGLPPPLPPPRSRGSNGYRESHSPRQQPVPVPLPLRQLRGSHSGSPLAQSTTQISEPDERYSVSPTDSRLSTTSAPLSTNHYRDHDSSMVLSQQYNEPTRHANYERFPPLDDHANLAHSRSFPSTPQSYALDAPDMHDGSRDPNMFRRSHHMSNQFGPGYDTNSRYSKPASRQSPYAEQTPPNGYSPQPGWSDQDTARVHRASVPIIKPRAVSPNPRTPNRKSVSPQPNSTPRDTGLGGTPFSPDSYEQFNPNLSAARSINTPTPKYNTPESLREVARELEKEEKLKGGPIVNSAGRVVDPSDHLPSDTWAPEPEKKTPRKSHQINVKFRHMPQGTQSLPTSAQHRPSRAPMRGQAVPPPETINRPPPVPPMPHIHSADDISPTQTGRNRLQKRNAPAPVHFNSSPAVPLNHNSPSPHALREHPNYGYNHSPSYQRGPQAGPPPVPAKVPFGRGQEDWGISNIQDDFSSIDIGPGRPRRTQMR